MIYIFGDSHRAKFLFYDEGKNDIPRVRVFGASGLTAYGMGGGEDAPPGVPQYDSHGRQLLDEMLSEVQPDDVILFVLGEVDCRIHLFYQHLTTRDPIDVVIGNVIKRFGSMLSEVAQYYQIAVLSVLPAVSQGNFYDIPHYGTRIQRAVITKLFNRALGAWCEENGIPFIDLTPQLADKDGFLKESHAERDEAHASVHTVSFIDLTEYYPGAVL